MVSWVRAYTKAFKVVLQSLLGFIIGGLLFLKGFGGYLWDGGLIDMIKMLLGVSIASLGPIAAIIKSSAETKE